MPTEREFIFTFGVGQPLGGCYTVVKAFNADEARRKMFDAYGKQWAFQYDSREQAGVERWNLREVEFGTPNEPSLGTRSLIHTGRYTMAKLTITTDFGISQSFSSEGDHAENGVISETIKFLNNEFEKRAPKDPAVTKREDDE